MKNLILIGILILAGIIFYLKFKRATPGSEKNLNTRAEGSVFYHEDDFCQVQVLPNENFRRLVEQVGDLKDFSKKSFDGQTYEDMMVREEVNVKLSQRKIKPSELDAIFSRLDTEKHTEVTTGYGSEYRIKSINTIGYGKDYSVFYYDHDAHFVKNIWMTNIWALDKEKVIHVLSEMGSQWNLLLMDWNTFDIIDLKDTRQIEKYLKST